MSVTILDPSPPHPTGTLPLPHMHVRQLPATSKGLAYGRAYERYYEGSNEIVKTHYMCWRVSIKARYSTAYGEVLVSGKIAEH